jgi:hypothetical protein
VIFLYQLTERKGYFKVMQDSITGITVDRRLQLLLVAFSYGAFFEGGGGFGAPLAVSGLSLIANPRRLPSARQSSRWPASRDSICCRFPAWSDAHCFSSPSLFRSADLGFLRLSRHGGNLAGHPHCGRDLRTSAVPYLQLPWPVAGKRRCGRDLNGLPDAVSEGLEDRANLDIDDRQIQRRQWRYAQQRTDRA